MCVLTGGGGGGPGAAAARRGARGARARAPAPRRGTAPRRRAAPTVPATTNLLTSHCCTENIKISKISITSAVNDDAAECAAAAVGAAKDAAVVSVSEPAPPLSPARRFALEAHDSY